MGFDDNVFGKLLNLSLNRRDLIDHMSMDTIELQTSQFSAHCSIQGGVQHPMILDDGIVDLIGEGKQPLILHLLLEILTGTVFELV